jgi:hypothetical protein
MLLTPEWVPGPRELRLIAQRRIGYQFAPEKFPKSVFGRLQ